MYKDTQRVVTVQLTEISLGQQWGPLLGSRFFKVEIETIIISISRTELSVKYANILTETLLASL